MIWRKMLSMVLAMWCAPAAVAQPALFFDDFDGNALLPHWYQPPPWHWSYTVSNSMLTVHGLHYPSSTQSPSNGATLTSTAFEPQSDFRMDAWMGWEAGAQPHQLEVRLLGPFGANPIIATMGYRSVNGLDPVIFVGASNQGFAMPAPAPGIHHFTISRTAGQFHFHLNGGHFATFPDSFGTPAAHVGFTFVGPYPGPIGAFHIDRVIVVPAPGALALVLVVPLLRSQRMRR